MPPANPEPRVSQPAEAASLARQSRPVPGKERPARSLKAEHGQSRKRYLRRQIRFTAEGEQLIGYARKMLALNNEALDSLQKRQVSGQLSLGIPEDYAFLLTSVLSHFSQLFPAVQLQVICGAAVAPGLLKSVDDGADARCCGRIGCGTGNPRYAHAPVACSGRTKRYAGPAVHRDGPAPALGPPD